MATTVGVFGITHNPFMPRLFSQPTWPPGAEKVMQRIEMMREKLRQVKPDVLVMIGNDHLNQFFMDNMPAFLIGKMEAYEGIFYNEVREFGLKPCRVAGDMALAEAILTGALNQGVDFAYSNELRIDHSIVVPLRFIRPDMDLPIVPIMTNCIAPPLPSARRFYEVGKTLRKIVDASLGDRRVAFVVSGHLSLEVGGPKQFERKVLDGVFDERAVQWVAEGDIEGAAAACEYRALQGSGNMTHGFLNFLLAAGASEGLPNSHAEGLDAGFPSIPFFSWERAA